MDLLPCPFCGMEPSEDLSDTLYPSGIVWNTTNGIRCYFRYNEGLYEGMSWKMICNESYGGCGATISGDSEEETKEKWNNRK